MRLVYVGAAGCPGEQAFRDAVGAHVRGWDPFAPNAPWRLAVSVVKRPSGYEGTAELRGAVVWTRAFPPTPRCVDLLEDLAVAVALHIDPPRLPPRSVPAPAALVPEPFRPADGPTPRPPPGRSPAGLRAGARGWMDLASAPRPAFGATLDVGYRVGWFSIAAQVRYDAPAGATLMGGAGLSTMRILGGVVPCGHVGGRFAFVGCLVAEAGEVVGTASAARLALPDRVALPALDIGARVGAEIRLAGPLYAQGSVDLLGVAVRPRFYLDPGLLWQSPAFIGGGGLGLGVAF
jgi:hypothetical protein